MVGSMMQKSVIEVGSLVKQYGNLRAVDSISFEVYEGEIFAFLGPNGAGSIDRRYERLCLLLTSTSLLLNYLTYLAGQYLGRILAFLLSPLILIQ